jgi:hypothetical protein
VIVSDPFTAYGQLPVAVESYGLSAWEPFMHYLYLPVRLTWLDGFRNGSIVLPPDLDFAYDLIADAWADACEYGHQDSYIYVTARRGFATPDNPLNRPGWHCDGFGTDDLNYVWCDRWSTRYAVGDFLDISSDHLVSMDQFAEQCVESNPNIRIIDRPVNHLYRLNPFVVHTTPEIPAPGGMRSFLKVSFSKHRYNLLGNSHNYGLDYDWPMYPRDIARNDPARAMGDFYVDG